ncbi:phage protein NinX family protein [Pseudomonas aeruginosa]|nr:DUF2591 family protein [Pseudomonas aeruginosa]EKY4157509.1 DUF2591 family protein [Pseudomonas aeruginosa]MBG6277893.1 DUF2591 family protein [Pseudomonas aeruginosa]HCA6709202.1 DUF2591 family protein [Pseudomonas aeruginosa]HEJ2236461.1 DUF2591 family protein [Pseudomonas aeruginosa]
MSETVEVMTCELEGPALDWAVGCIEDEQIERKQIGWLLMNLKVWIPLPDTPYFDIVTHWSPSTDWSQGGPLIEKYRFEFEWVGSDWHGEPLNFFTACGFDMPADATSAGPTHLIAACRAIVRAKHGKTVSVPAELIK